MKITAIVQARMGSTRLPGKVMKSIAGIPIIELLLLRLSKAKLLDSIIVAIPEGPENKILADHLDHIGFQYIYGNERDVLSRFYLAAKKFDSDVIVRITGDCPLVDPCLVDKVIRNFISSGKDYVSNASPPTYPDGLDVEVFSRKALNISYSRAQDIGDREHVTPYIRRSPEFSRGNIEHNRDFSKLRWTLDEPEDFELIEKIFSRFSPDIYFNWEKVIELQTSEPKIFEVNQSFTRNEGEIMGTGQKLYKRAKKLIPGGTMLLSKRPEMFLPEKWPSYFSKAKGCEIWDLDGKKYIDMSVMGIGTNILGYGHEEIDDAVMRVVQSGNMSTLNCAEEVYLADQLVQMHPWADMVKFARSGGEANAIAIRIARASVEKDQVAVCGYHGWHDWYLAVNLNSNSNDGLKEHLLPGLSTNGVPQHLGDTVFPFSYNNFDELQALVDEKNIGVIKMEVTRNSEPEDNFLEKVRKLATDKGIVLIFDECSSGFRESFGGIHTKYGVEPDIAMFGKAMGNGYAITAVLGRKEIMESAQSSFISSTFWTERIGPSAALKTLEIMKREKSWEKITQTGLNIRKGIKNLANKYQLDIFSWGLPSITGYTFTSDRANQYKTLITQEMLKKGFLAANSTYVSISHSQEIVDRYIELLDPIFGLISECEQGRDIDSLIDDEICHTGFERLN